MRTRNILTAAVLAAGLPLAACSSAHSTAAAARAIVKPGPTVTVTVTSPAPAITRTVRRTVTHTVTVTATPAAPATTAPASGSTVATFSGSGIQNTSKFTVSDTWKLDYSYWACPGGQGNFIVNEDGGEDFGGASVNQLGSGGSASTMGYGDSGTHYLSVNSECSWSVKVIDEG